MNNYRIDTLSTLIVTCIDTIASYDGPDETNFLDWKSPTSYRWVTSMYRYVTPILIKVSIQNWCIIVHNRHIFWTTLAHRCARTTDRYVLIHYYSRGLTPLGVLRRGHTHWCVNLKMQQPIDTSSRHIDTKTKKCSFCSRLATKQTTTITSIQHSTSWEFLNIS